MQDYFQVLAIFSQSKVQWPPEVKQLYRLLSAFNLNIEIVAPECEWGQERASGSRWPRHARVR